MLLYFLWRRDLLKSIVKDVEIRFFAHATEDPNLVLNAVSRVLPSNILESVKPKRIDLRGHHGNPISLYRILFKKEEDVEAVLRCLSENLSDDDKETLAGHATLHVGDGSLYLRLDKQKALTGEFSLCHEDPIRIRIRFRRRKPEAIIEASKALGLMP